MRKFALFVAPLLLLLALAVAGCGKGGGGTSSATCSTGTVDMTASNFAVDCANIKAGSAITFVDPASAAIHILCIGKDQKCDASAPGPAELTGGKNLTVNPGDTKSVTFPTAGTYEVTCTVHANVNLTVTVS